MRRLLLIGLAVAAIAPAVGVYAVAALGAPVADGKLLATVGPGASISLVTAGGAAVTHLDPGTYDIEIDDRSSEHNFHLFGPGGVSAATEVGFVGVRTVTVTLGNGEFTFVCDVHPYDMIGQFTVGSGGATPPPPPSGSGLLPKLVATVGPKMTISLTKGGVRVKTLKPRRYEITVRDRSPIHNFHLKGPGVNKKTGVAYHATTTWKVTLTAGKYGYWCDPHRPGMHGSFRVGG